MSDVIRYGIHVTYVEDGWLTVKYCFSSPCFPSAIAAMSEVQRRHRWPSLPIDDKCRRIVYDRLLKQIKIWEDHRKSSVKEVLWEETKTGKPEDENTEFALIPLILTAELQIVEINREKTWHTANKRPYKGGLKLGEW